jgi:hypothetical protein
LAALVLVLTLSACGGSIAPGAGDASGTANPTASAPAQTTPPGPICPRPVVRFVDALTELDSRLSVGLNYANYSDHVGDARVAYDRIDVKDLDLDCLTDVGAPAEKALNYYIDAYKIWNDCVGDIYCSNDDIRSKLQRKWAQATAKIDKAKAALR